MKKGELIKAMVKKTEYSAAVIKEILSALEETVTEALQKSGKVEIPGVAILKVVRTKAQKATTKVVFGEQRRVAAKAASIKVKARVKKVMQEAVKGAKSRGRR
jgi:nucleoid DNA-binding protein